ncbi:hypothetical protein V8D89_001890 [Ganoderma adspersum]
MTSFQTRAATNSICGVLFSRANGTFHWAIVIPSNNSDHAEILHANNPVEAGGRWSFQRKTHDVYASRTACIIVKIGTLTATNTIERITNLLEGIPMAIPLADRTIEPRFTCRVWFKEAIRVLARNGVLTCPDVSALERKMIEYGQEQALSTSLGGGYKYHVPSSSLIC